MCGFEWLSQLCACEHVPTFLTRVVPDGIAWLHNGVVVYSVHACVLLALRTQAVLDWICLASQWLCRVHKSTIQFGLLRAQCFKIYFA